MRARRASTGPPAGYGHASNRGRAAERLVVLPNDLSSRRNLAVGVAPGILRSGAPGSALTLAMRAPSMSTTVHTKPCAVTETPGWGKVKVLRAWSGKPATV
jgi:hypothetical protein